MNWSRVRILLRHEMRTLVRDRRTMILSVALPVLIMPLMLFATKIINERREKTLEQTVYKYAITGSQAAKVRQLIQDARASRAAQPSKQGRDDSLENFKFEEIQLKDPAAGLKAKDIHFYLEALSGEEADALPKKPEAKKDPDDPETPSGLIDKNNLPPTRLKGVPLVKIYFQADRDVSQAGQRKVRDLLTRARRQERDRLLQKKGFPIDPVKVLATNDTSVASAGQVTGSYLGRFLTVFLLMFMLSGGAVAAMDIVAGEKERGSLETLLTTAARRSEIVAAKQLAIVAVALVITFIQVANILVYLTFKVIKLPKNFVIEAPPATILTLLLLFIPVAAVVAAALLMISAYAKSYKEAQLYFFPVYLISLIPGMAAVLPGISLRSAIVAVPVANVSVAVREVMVGKFDWPMIFVTFGVMALTAMVMLRASEKMLSRERLITASDSDAADLAGGAALFPKHVLRWYAVIGAILFAAAANVPQLATFRRQIVFNLLFLFLGGSLLMIRKYRLNIREALALRPVKPVVWLAVLLAIPSGHVVSIGVFRLANLVVPVPEQVLEQFSRDILPKNIPFWQLVFLITVMPGICEEISFRGTLLYGLRRRFHPAVLALVVGVIFGFFHVSLFRILPTAFMGVILTVITLLTGSIFPSMLAHAGNNGFALWAGLKGFPLGDLSWWLYLAAAAIFALSMYIIYRVRTPYPGLRTSSNAPIPLSPVSARRTDLLPESQPRA